MPPSVLERSVSYLMSFGCRRKEGSPLFSSAIGEQSIIPANPSPTPPRPAARNHRPQRATTWLRRGVLFLSITLTVLVCLAFVRSYFSPATLVRWSLWNVPRDDPYAIAQVRAGFAPYRPWEWQRHLYLISDRGILTFASRRYGPDVTRQVNPDQWR